MKKIEISVAQLNAIHERIAGGDRLRAIAADAGVSPATISRIKKAWAANRPLIATAGAYADISNEDYHRNPRLVPGPSLSSSGAKAILSKSPFHYWFDSPLNPDRPSEPDKPHFNVGKAAHDMLLLEGRWRTAYHVTPEGFAWNKTKQFEEAIGKAERARKAGKTILSFDQWATVTMAAAAVRKSDLAVATLTNGVTEETLVWQDPHTGIWLRARPDFRPNSILEKRDVMVVPDLKFVAPTHATPDGFAKAIYDFGYHQSAAFYADGIKAVYGHYPTHWLHVVVEREPPFSVSLYELPGEDIERGRVMNRRAINLFAECLKTGRWPAYAEQPLPVGLPDWARMKIESRFDEFAWSAAA